MSLSQVLKKYISIQSAFTCWHAPLHVCLRIGVLRVAYVFIIVIIISFPFVLPSPPRSLPPHLFFFLHSFATVAKRREAVRRRDAIRRVAARMWKYDGNISLFAALARPDDSVAVPRHEAFISRYVYIHRYVQAPGSSLNKCRSIYKGGEMRIFPSPFPFLRCSSSCCSSSKSSLFLYLSLVSFHVPISRNGWLSSFKGNTRIIVIVNFDSDFNYPV